MSFCWFLLSSDEGPKWAVLSITTEALSHSFISPWNGFQKLSKQGDKNGQVPECGRTAFSPPNNQRAVDRYNCAVWRHFLFHLLIKWWGLLLRNIIAFLFSFIRTCTSIFISILHLHPSIFSRVFLTFPLFFCFLNCHCHCHILSRSSSHVNVSKTLNIFTRCEITRRVINRYFDAEDCCHLWTLGVTISPLTAVYNNTFLMCVIPVVLCTKVRS